MSNSVAHLLCLNGRTVLSPSVGRVWRSAGSTQHRDPSTNMNMKFWTLSYRERDSSWASVGSEPICTSHHLWKGLITDFDSYQSHFWLIMNPVSWPHCRPLTLSAVYGDHLDAPDGHAEVHRWRLQRGLAGGEEALLFPGGQTLHVLLSNLQLPREGKPGLKANPAHSETPPAHGLFYTCSLYSSCVFQAKEMLTMKLPSWQEKCSDITKVPDTVMTMIEELSTTPEQSPEVERYNRVGISSACAHTVGDTMNRTGIIFELSFFSSLTLILILLSEKKKLWI